MTWGKDLWDQFDQIASHTSKGIEFCEKFAQFTKERAVIENDYAAKLKKLVKSYQPKKKEEDIEWTTVKAFNAVLAEVFDMAGQHEMVADNLSNNVYKELLTLVQLLKQERKKNLLAGHKQNMSLQNQIQQLDKSKGKYEKAFKEMEKAQEAYRKADADKHMSRADVEKAQINMQQKQQACEESRNDYASELSKTNQCQQQHYDQHMPAIFDLLEEMDQRRTERVQEMVRGCADVEKNILPIINSCISGIDRAADTISFSEDAKLVVDKLKSGFNPPGDLPFEDLSKASTTENTATPPSSSLRVTRSELQTRNSFSVGSMKNKRKTRILSLFTSNKLVNMLTDETKEDFSHLPPNQQRKKLHQKVESLRSSLAKQTAERDGMLKMQDVYKQNNALGDPSSLAKQLEENGLKLDRLRLELQKYEDFMSEVDSGAGSKSKLSNSSSPLTSINDKINHRSSLLHTDSKSSNNDNSLTDSFNNNNNNNNVSKSSNNNNSSYLFSNNDNDTSETDRGNLDILGPTCYSLFPFTAVSEGSISMVEGEEFEVLESDQGDGWVQVRRLTNQEEGFVPSSYVRMHHDKEFDDYDDDSVTS